VVNTTAAEVKSGEPITLAVSKLDLTSLGSPANTSLRAEFADAAGTVTALGTVPVSAGAATVSVLVPAGAVAGTGTLVLTAVESGTVVKADVLVAASVPVPPQCTAPVKPKRPADLVGQANYGTAMAAYRKCLKG
jgi:5'-nucleotidase